MFAALGGLGYVTGYPDGPPVELRHAMDHTGGMMAAFSAVAALCAHRSHQVGQRADVAVRDIATAFMGHALMDTAMNRRDAVRQGNRDDAMAPHGVFPCRGDDAWVTIAVGSDSEWRALKGAMGNPAWADGDDYGDAFLRWRNQDALEQHLSEWTCNLTAESVTGLLQAAGIAAFPSLSADQLLDDPHLTERNAFPVVTHVTKRRAAGGGSALAVFANAGRGGPLDARPGRAQPRGVLRPAGHGRVGISRPTERQNRLVVLALQSRRKGVSRERIVWMELAE